MEGTLYVPCDDLRGWHHWLRSLLELDSKKSEKLLVEDSIKWAHSVGIKFCQSESLTASAKAAVVSIPGVLGNCNHLLMLNLSNNRLSGEMPDELGNLIHLQSFLDLCRNSISGDIPSNMGKLTILENLSLSHNNLSGGIPTEVSSMGSLQSIDLSYNELSSQIPNGKIFQKASAEVFI
ncbi:hypothetical protein NE237_018572 [Protea cynaroides]|uniref:Uncharacterized protein n=1 Tax=Protea cynaroides TaxID=273540 RepID=A0A9Q0KA54_9MAGN|nr:hypothetical protein NE237_018572 [Protea cynaroides]